MSADPVCFPPLPLLRDPVSSVSGTLISTSTSSNGSSSSNVTDLDTTTTTADGLLFYETLCATDPHRAIPLLEHHAVRIQTLLMRARSSVSSRQSPLAPPAAAAAADVKLRPCRKRTSGGRATSLRRASVSASMPATAAAAAAVPIETETDLSALTCEPVLLRLVPVMDVQPQPQQPEENDDEQQKQQKQKKRKRASETERLKTWDRTVDAVTETREMEYYCPGCWQPTARDRLARCCATHPSICAHQSFCVDRCIVDPFTHHVPEHRIPFSSDDFQELPICYQCAEFASLEPGTLLLSLPPLPFLSLCHHTTHLRPRHGNAAYVRGHGSYVYGA
jgi:hypothetical protein